MRLTNVRRGLTNLLDVTSMKLLDAYCIYHPSPVTLRQLVDFGRSANEQQSFDFVKREIPVRMANIMKEINLLPATLLAMPSVIELQEMYAKSFMKLCEFSGQDGHDRKVLKAFLDGLAQIRRRHQNVVQLLAQGVLELKETHAVDPASENRIQYFLDRFYMSRISTNTLLNQHYELFGHPPEEKDLREHIVGSIDTRCRIKSLVQDTFTDAGVMCEQFYCHFPDYSVLEVNEDRPGEPIEVPYLPGHLRHILFELFKNAMRATVEYARRRNRLELPDINVLIAKGGNDVSIKISDQGGGISRNINDNLFHYLYSTAPRPALDGQITPLAGFGYGLPLSRLYARYLHGDLSLSSYEGHGTDAVIYIKSRAEDMLELLPVFNKTSSKQYRSSLPAADWTNPYSTMNRLYHPQFHIGDGPRMDTSRSSPSAGEDLGPGLHSPLNNL